MGENGLVTSVLPEEKKKSSFAWIARLKNKVDLVVMWFSSRPTQQMRSKHIKKEHLESMTSLAIHRTFFYSTGHLWQVYVFWNPLWSWWCLYNVHATMQSLHIGRSVKRVEYTEHCTVLRIEENAFIRIPVTGIQSRFPTVILSLRFLISRIECL